jgi:competence protein ComEC
MKAYDAAFYIAVFFILGVAAAGFGLNIWLTSALSVFLIVFLYIFPDTLFNKSAKLCSLVSIILLGFFYYYFFGAFYKDIIVFDKNITFKGIVFEEPNYGLESQEINISLQNPYKGEVKVYSSVFPQFHYGDLLELKGVIKKSSFGDFNISSLPKIEILKENQGNAFKADLYKIKNILISNLQEVLPVGKSALASGLLFGEQSEFSKEFKENMKNSGTTHLVALSGYNIAIIGLAVSAALSYILNREKAFYVSVLVIISFVLMTGAEESVVRAAVMGIIALIAEQNSRLYSLRNAITLTALFMVILNPKVLVFNVGFQLSFAALLGLIYLQPIFGKVFKINDNPGSFGWRKNFTQTLSAQIAAFPIIITTFGYFSPVSLLANVLILEFIPLTMFLSFITAVAGLLSYELSLLMGWIAGFLLGYEIFIINFFNFNRL